MPAFVGLPHRFPRFLRAVTSFNPDVIVCTHFTPANLTAFLYDKKKIAAPPAIAITDLDCHAMWLVRSYERYFVALDETRAYLEQLGIQPERITVSGIPVHPAFRQLADKQAARQKLGLAPHLFTVLVCAGGHGIGPIASCIRELRRLESPAQVVAIAGRAEALKNTLDALAAQQGAGARVPLTAVGFTMCMELYMAAADIVITKPGGLTTSEALAAGVPLCIINPLPGQEERNSDHLLEAGAAIRCNNLPTLPHKIQQLINNPDRLAQLAANARAMGRPLAGQTIVRCLLGG